MAETQDRADMLVRAKFAEQLERYEDMAASIKKYVELGAELNTNEERNLLSVAYKNLISPKRSSWRVICSIEEKVQGSDKKVEMAQWFRKRIVQELGDICREVLGLVDKYLMGKAIDSEGKLFYLKLQADYYRYLAEVLQGTEQKEVIEKSEAAYNGAIEIAYANFQPTNSMRLGLALNYSVFLYEIMSSPDRACQFAKKAFDDAIAELDTLNEESYKDSTFIMQLLRDNLTIWSSDTQEGEGESAEAK